MSENCNHDCNSCSANCASREGGTPDFTAPANANSRVKKVISVVSGKVGVLLRLAFGLVYWIHGFPSV